MNKKIIDNKIIENSANLSKKLFQKNTEFIYKQWKPVCIDGWNTYILDIGKGWPLIFVPIVQNIEAFDSLLIQHFSKKYRVITYQRRESETEFLDIDSRSNDIKKILYHLKIAKAHFISHSSGSVAVTNLALKHPELFFSYVWMNLSPKPAMDMALWRKILAKLAEFIPIPENVAIKVLSKTAAGGDESFLYQRIMEQFFAVRRTANIKNLKKWFSHSVWTMAKYDWSKGLQKLMIPTLLINSDNDEVNSIKAMDMIYRQLPNCYGYKITRGGRHFFQYTRADQVIRYMEEFYSEL